MVGRRSKGTLVVTHLSQKEHIPRQLRKIKVGQGTLINLKRHMPALCFSNTVPVQTNRGSPGGCADANWKAPLGPSVPKCKVATANPKIVHTRVFGMTAASRISSIRQASTPPSSLNGSQVTAPMNELWIPNASPAQLGTSALLSIIKLYQNIISYLMPKDAHLGTARGCLRYISFAIPSPQASIRSLLKQRAEP